MQSQGVDSHTEPQILMNSRCTFEKTQSRKIVKKRKRDSRFNRHHKELQNVCLDKISVSQWCSSSLRSRYTLNSGPFLLHSDWKISGYTAYTLNYTTANRKLQRSFFLLNDVDLQGVFVIKNCVKSGVIINPLFKGPVCNFQWDCLTKKFNKKYTCRFSARE